MSGRSEVRVVQKPWGHETIWAQTGDYVGKVLHIKAGHALSVQYHVTKDETIHLLRGEMIYRVASRRMNRCTKWSSARARATTISRDTCTRWKP